MFELIQYTPQTPTVSTIRLLMFPPVINKFYAMDIAPGRSMVEYVVANFLRQPAPGQRKRNTRSHNVKIGEPKAAP